VFLDEIGELPLEMQPKLLRTLEERVIRRVGGAEAIKLDVRIIAATNRDLRRAVNKGTFRADVFYRLNSVVLTVPPLRSRREDIEFLAAHFYRQFSGDDAAEIPEALLESLLTHEWPGNVRELRGAIERAVLLGGNESGDRPVNLPSMAPPPSSRSMLPEAELDLSTSFRSAKEVAIARWERDYITKLLSKFDGNLSRAARAARMDRNHLREVARRHNLAPLND
jgi:transcriptional regulator with GAF, ATPase, and Fis domain